ncbi:MAG: hypothetical protein QM754_20525 [Tepidisphaeraceae bacterium]
MLGRLRQCVKRGVGLGVWVVSGFGLVPLLLAGRGKASETVVVYTVHPAFFLWPLILGGFAMAAVQHHWPQATGLLGWAYLWLVIYTLVAVLFDLGTARLLFWTGILAFLWLGLRYLEDLKHVPVVTQIVAYFRGLHPAFDGGLATALSTLLVPAWIGSLVHSFCEGQKTFTPNSVEERFVGHGNEVTDRSGLTFRMKYRDLLESLLGFGAADLEAVDAQGRVSKRFSNVLFLAFTWKKLDGILHQRAATVDNAIDDPVEVEQVFVDRSKQVQI